MKPGSRVGSNSALAGLDAEDRERFEALSRSAAQLDLPRPLQQSILLGALAQEGLLPSSAYLAEVNHTVRMEWLRLTLDPGAFRETIDPNEALPLELMPRLIELGLVGTTQQALRDVPGGREYRALCRENGVPPPPDWLKRQGMTRGDWRYEGDLKTNFLRLGTPTEVWSFRSTSPAGTCIALPRFASSDLISAAGIICLGTDTGNACFYDKADLDPEADYPIDEFQAGATLQGGGICTDCHAGENPFIVHPAEPLNLGSAIRSPIWHVPLVKPSWPQNPGPMGILNQLELPPGERKCSECHVAGFAGRFPDVLALKSRDAGVG